jgi:integrase
MTELLNDAQIHHFLSWSKLPMLLYAAEIQRAWLPDFILWAVHSGMSKGEIQRLLWSDILELEPNRVYVLAHKRGHTRLITATPTMREILAHQKSRTEDVWRVFPTYTVTLGQRWAAACKSAGCANLTFHHLRRTYVYLAILANVDSGTLASRMGDLKSLPENTRRPIESDERAAEKIQEVFDQMQILLKTWPA